MKTINPKHIGVIVQSDYEFFPDRKTYEISIGSLKGLKQLLDSVANLHEDEPPLKIEDKELISETLISYPEIVYVSQDDAFIYPPVARRLIQAKKAQNAMTPTLRKIEELTGENTKTKKTKMWPDEFGAGNLEETTRHLISWLQKNLPEQEYEAEPIIQTARAHELSHLSFFQRYPKITGKLEEIEDKIYRQINLTTEEADIYQMLRAVEETDAILTEENPWIFHLRMARMLVGLKTITGEVENCDNYHYVQALFSKSTEKIFYSDAYFNASCLIAFGRQILEYNSETNSLRFNPNFMFETNSWEEGQQPTHEQIVRFLQRWEATQMEILEAGFEAYVQRLSTIREELSSIIQPYLEKLETGLEESDSISTIR